MPAEPATIIYVRLRDNSERTRRVRIKAELIPELVNGLINNMDVREFSIASEFHRHHKSYAEDFTPPDPDDGMDLLEYLRKRNDLPLIDPANSIITESQD